MTPTEMGQLADDYSAARDFRLAEAKKVKKLEEAEKALKTSLISAMAMAEIKAIGGQVVTITLKEKDEPTVINWEDVYGFIKEHDAFDLLQKRLSNPAVVLRWEDAIEIPGISTYPVQKLSISKV